MSYVYRPDEHKPWYKGFGKDTKGLVVYTNASALLKRRIEDSWRTFMGEKFPEALYLDGPLLMSVEPLVLRGHVDRFKQKDAGEVFLLQQLALRPEICQTAYEVYRLYLRKGVETPILQIGRCARKQRTTEGSLIRLNEFTQADVQIMHPRLDLDTLRDLTLEWLQAIIRGDIRCIEKIDKPHYSVKTYDLQVFMRQQWVEVCSINDRGTFDLGIPLLESSAGIDRIMDAILTTGGLPIRVVRQGDVTKQLVVSAPQACAKILRSAGFTIDD